MNATAEQFGVLLRERRRRQGLSQAELGGSRYSGSYISHLESGRRVASPEVIEFLSHRLGVSPKEWVPTTAVVSKPVAGAGAIEDLLVAERAWSDHDWQAAIDHASTAAEVAHAAGDLGRQWEALYVVGQAKFSSGMYAEAAETAASLAEHPIASQFGVARAQALCLASTANRAADHLGWAIAFGARAVDAAVGAPPVVMAEALMAAVSALSEAGYPASESRDYLDQLAALAPRLKSDHSRGWVEWTLGTAAFKAGDVEAGREHHAAARQLLDPKCDLRLWVRFQRAAANCLLDAGIVDGVAELVANCAIGLEVIGNRHDLADVRRVQAKFAMAGGEPERAVEILTGTLEDPVLGADDVFGGSGHLLLARALFASGDVQASVAQLELAAGRFEQEGRLREAVDVWRMVREGRPTDL